MLAVNMGRLDNITIFVEGGEHADVHIFRQLPEFADGFLVGKFCFLCVHMKRFGYVTILSLS
jgi:hypothetical protein